MSSNGTKTTQPSVHGAPTRGAKTGGAKTGAAKTGRVKTAGGKTAGAKTRRAPTGGAPAGAGQGVEEYTPVQRGGIAAFASRSVVNPTDAHVQAARQHAALGIQLARDGRLEMAIERLREAASLDPSVALVQHDLGLACLMAERLEEAVSALYRAVALAPDLTSAHGNLAVALESLGREREALAAWESVVRLEPARHEVHAQIGQIHLANKRMAQAEAAFRAAAANATGSQAARIYQARAAKSADRPAVAEALLRQVIADDPACAEAHALLGRILAESGRTGEAAASYERCISFDPAMAGAWYPFAILKKFTRGDQALIDRISGCLQRPDIKAPQRQAIHFALGKAYDDLGDYAAAMHHRDAANRIRGAGRRLDRTKLDRRTSRTIAATPAGYLARRPDPGSDDETPILIVGMPRSGTTLVEQILSSHPDVAAGGELGFWGKQNVTGPGPDPGPEVVRRLANDYLDVLRGISPDAVRVTDKMPFNFAHLGLIRQVFPRATIVHCRRNPVDTCLSIFGTDFTTPYEFASDRGDLVFFYRQYQRLMAHWREVLPADRLIEIDYETLVADPEPVSRRLIADCGLEWDDACGAPHQNPRPIVTASLWQARQPVYRTSVERWRHYEPWLGELRSLLTGADEPVSA
jgi:tetratricopeptide (TPR) repeat protein